jgi:hypothetical protein
VYPPGQLERVRSTCLYVATKLGDLLTDIVVVGGLVPSLIIDESALPRELNPILELKIWISALRLPYLTRALSRSQSAPARS